MNMNASPELRVTTDKDELDLERIHELLKSAYWSKNIPLEIVERAFANSFAFGLLHEGKQIGFGRFVTDYATFAYLADVFIEEPYRGRGYARLLIDTVLAHPDIRGLRRILLATADAHGVYAPCGFEPLAKPRNFMEINRPDIYLRSDA
ncbi:GCN5-related N-acetyltransferase protein [Azotobacter vinelandii CA]|uniref:GCN5-related N-acetyltransferase protein n=3 Tax=Azotobacter vinelandii TaxID=354 RepID=C1DGB6_AZOVD|nr:GNAT family N-acetyltransferase [Azotobacter vinelandii]ACO78427.1 GCN5-related N-acetyltransferase protein [Azotobacter vinelandii DJ]AGK15021.1 GCN5-related N-acetyltransferase protein [Azotobacter vinelandii CA]AGK20496.1 GCN5-related N-acetyltransferase protein [Azotobacter vinelandii CA6]WKN24128.1 GNAT family N-acetyltransferase [Azotobacter vinelandii]SFY26779.1 Acetyltransferase (GNAT) family protein [Azotobacter vinelandii]